MPREHNTYLDQFARVKRWYDRLKEVNSGKRHDRDTSFYGSRVESRPAHYFNFCLADAATVQNKPAITTLIHHGGLPLAKPLG